MKMIKLPDGSLIRREAITAARKGYKTESIPPRVIVDYVNGDHGNSVIVNCGSDEERDELVARIAGELA